MENQPTTYMRDFESKEAFITVSTENFLTFDVYTQEYKENGLCKPVVKQDISFTIGDIDGACNSEKIISDFISKQYNLSNVYSLNDFEEVQERTKGVIKC